MQHDDMKLEEEFDRFLAYTERTWKYRIDFIIENPLFKARAIAFLENEIAENFILEEYDYLFNHKYDFSQFFTDREDIAMFLKLKGFEIIGLQDRQKYQANQ